MSGRAAEPFSTEDELEIMKARPNVFQPRMVALVRAAWAGGVDAGERDAMDPDIETHTCTPNPYEKEQR